MSWDEERPRGPMLAWPDILARDDVVGGDIEIYSRACVYRGPVKNMEYDPVDDCVTLEMQWTACRDVENGLSGRWYLWPKTTYCFRASESFPVDLGHGRIHFSIVGEMDAVIYPRGGSRLDPRAVDFLDPKLYE